MTYVVTIISQPGIIRITSAENVRVWGTGSENEIILYDLICNSKLSLICLIE